MDKKSGKSWRKEREEREKRKNGKSTEDALEKNASTLVEDTTKASKQSVKCDEPTKPSTEISEGSPSLKSPEKPSVKTSEEPLAKSTEKSLAKSAEKKPISNSSEKPISKSSEKPISKFSEKPISKSSEKPLSKTLEKPLSKSLEKPLSKSSEKSFSKSLEKPLPKSSEKPLPKSSEKHVAKSVEKPLPKAVENPSSRYSDKHFPKYGEKSDKKSPEKSNVKYPDKPLKTTEKQTTRSTEKLANKSEKIISKYEEKNQTKSIENSNAKSLDNSQSVEKKASTHNEKSEAGSGDTKSSDNNKMENIERNDVPEEKPITIDDEQIREENRLFIIQYVNESEERLIKKAQLRTENLHAAKERPELNTALLDSNLKKNTVFIKKMKNLRESQYETIEKDLKTLNLSKYMSEVTSAIVEAKLKMADIQSAIQICSILHSKYHDFSSCLLQNWQKILNIKKDDKITNMSKLRVDLRFYSDLICAGIITPKEGLPLLGNVLKTLVNTDKQEHQNVSVLLTFCKHCGEDYMGLVPRKIRQLADEHKMSIPKSEFLPTDRQKNVRNLLKDYYNSMVKHLQDDQIELQKLEKQNRIILQIKGELPSEKKEKVENLSEALDKLQANAKQMAELLDEDLPELIVPEIPAEEENVLDDSIIQSESMDGVAGFLWEDDDTKAFYTNLPDLKVLLPAILYSDSEKLPPAPIENDTKNDSDAQFDIEEDLSVTEEEEEEIQPPQLPAEDDQDEVSTGSTTTSNKILLEAFLSNLPNCISRDLMDKAALEFCLKLNTKPFRKKMVKALFLVPRTRLDLLPFYARLTATLNPLMPDVPADLVRMLKQDFRWQVKKKDQINIESKIKVSRFIGELVKFDIFPRSEALACIRMLLQDFNHHHIEMSCNLLETCGRYLYRYPDSHHRTRIYIEQMMRKKTVKAFDERYNTMIENAFFFVNPPDDGESAIESKKERPPMHQYIRILLYETLSKSNTEKILRLMRKLHWEDTEISNYAVKSLTAVWNAKFYNIRCIANLLAGLMFYHDWVGPAVVDGILEDIKLGMEINQPKFNQRRIACVKYLGELYNYKIIESSLIFKVLYLFITFGVSRDRDLPSEYDPPDHLFRLRLVTTLLDTCGQFFSSGSSKKKLDCFLIYFQHYFLFKKSVWPEELEYPNDIDNIIKDTILTVRPKIKLYSSLEDVEKDVIALNQQYIAKAIEQVPALKKYLDANYVNEESSNETGLPSIPENDVEDSEDVSILETEDFDIDESGDEEEVDDRDWNESQANSLTPSQSQQSHSSRLLQTNEDNGRGSTQDDVGDPISEVSPCMQVEMKQVHCEEDEDFMAAFDKLMADSVIERSREVPKPSSANISVPVQIKSSAKKTYEQLVSEEIEESPKPMVNFVLMTRTGNKQQYTNVEMPVNSELVTKLRNREELEKEERERVKKMTLEINERQEEEEAMELLQQMQRPTTMNCNRDRRPKYQHPKGAPDADLIFGPKRTR